MGLCLLAVKGPLSYYASTPQGRTDGTSANHARFLAAAVTSKKHPVQANYVIEGQRFRLVYYEAIQLLFFCHIVRRQCQGADGAYANRLLSYKYAKIFFESSSLEHILMRRMTRYNYIVLHRCTSEAEVRIPLVDDAAEEGLSPPRNENPDPSGSYNSVLISPGASRSPFGNLLGLGLGGHFYRMARHYSLKFPAFKMRNCSHPSESCLGHSES